MKALYVKYRRDVFLVVVAALLGGVGYQGCQSYRHFEWQNITISPGHVVAMPSFRKQ